LRPPTCCAGPVRTVRQRTSAPPAFGMGGASLRALARAGIRFWVGENSRRTRSIRRSGGACSPFHPGLEAGRVKLRRERAVTQELRSRTFAFWLMMDMVFQEQSFYWQRFTAFAGLHSGLFVLVTAALIGTKYWAALFVTVLSLVLAALCIGIQSVSLRYMSRWKLAFHEARRGLGITQKVPPDPRWSSTDLARCAPIVVFVVWVFVLFIVAT